MQIRVASLVLMIMILLLSFDMLAGPLRYYLAQVGLESTVYVPKAACLLFVVWEIVRGRMSRVLFYVILLLALFAFVGLVQNVGIFSIFFSLFVISPFLFGIATARYFSESEDIFVLILIFVFAVTALGVYLDVFLDFPWKGFAYTLNDLDIEGSREWGTFGFERVAGFTRMSAAAAFYLACSALFLFNYSRSWWHKLLVVLIASPSLLVTTNKAGIGGFVLGLASIGLSDYPRVQRMLVYGLASTVVFLPISSIVRNYELDLADPVSLILLASFEDRLNNTWPNFFAAVARFGNSLFGVGIGGVGSPIKFFASGSREILAVADNFALYLYGCFGLVSVALFLYFGRVAVKLFASQNLRNRSLAPVMVALLAASLTTDIIEAQILSLMLGIVIAVPHNSFNLSSFSTGAKI